MPFAALSVLNSPTNDVNIFQEGWRDQKEKCFKQSLKTENQRPWKNLTPQSQ